MYHHRFCVNCGSILADVFKYCPFCGTKADSSAISKVNEDDKYFDIRNGVLVKYTGRASNIVIPSSVVRIAEFAFLEEITGRSGMSKYVPNKYVTRIEVRDNVKIIEPYAFSMCESLKEVILPSSINRIEDGVFAGCIELVNVQIPNTVTYIGHNAFGTANSFSKDEWCSKLHVTIPESVTKIAEDSYRDSSDNYIRAFGGLHFTKNRTKLPTNYKLNKKYQQILNWIISGKCLHCGGNISIFSGCCKKCGKYKTSDL